MKIRSMGRLLLPLLLLVGLSGCSNIEPWVKPYERDRLADPIMSFDMNPVSGAYMPHVSERRTGAPGTVRRAGCAGGCN